MARVGIADFESPAAETLVKIDDATAEIIGAERIDDDWNTVVLRAPVIRPLLVQHHRVFHSGTSPRLDKNAQPFRFAFFFKQLLDLKGSRLRQANHIFLFGCSIHKNLWKTSSPPLLCQT